ncbi:MAG: LLM class F420-dependent oxidoreductase [Candidatus Binatia bacterium]|nr:LLM class F420-dependent oxidoreductase [Candidatus Binatia bacterium]
MGKRKLPALATALLLLAAAAGPTQANNAPRAERKILFGIQTTPQDFSYDELVTIWKDAEALGFDSAWVFDHFIPILGADVDGPCLEGWTLLSALAAHTSKIRVGVLVTGNTYRNPAILAKMATTVDHISRGRLYFGIGAGWFELEHRAYGIPFYDAKERAQRLEEALQVIKKLWTEDHPSFAGKFYTLERAPFAPKNVQKPHPPIVIGGQGKKWIVPLVGRYANGWNAPVGLTPDDIRHRKQIIRRACERAGRHDCNIEVSALLILYSISDVPLAGPVLRLGARMIAGERIQRSVLAGSPDEIASKIQGYIDAGVDHIIMNIQPKYDRKLLERFAAEVMPRFRRAAPHSSGE